MKNNLCVIVSLLWKLLHQAWCITTITYVPNYAPSSKISTMSAQNSHSIIACLTGVFQSQGPSNASGFFQYLPETGSCHVGSVDRHSLEEQPSLGLVQVMVPGKVSLSLYWVVWQGTILNLAPGVKNLQL